MSGYKSHRYVSSVAEECLGRELATLGQQSSGNAAWPATDRAIGFPLRVARAEEVVALFWQNGGTLTDNGDAGLYDASGTRLVSTGSTARTPASNFQFVSVSLGLGPGLYYLVMSLAGTTGTMGRHVPGDVGRVRAIGCVKDEAAFPLPASLGFEAVVDNYVPVIGVQYA